VSHVCDQAEPLLQRKELGAQCEELSLSAVQALELLRQDLRALTELPLQLSAVHGQHSFTNNNNTYIPLTLYPRRGSRGISDITLRCPRFTKII
jgi:hypothetical protein